MYRKNSSTPNSEGGCLGSSTSSLDRATSEFQALKKPSSHHGVTPALLFHCQARSQSRSLVIFLVEIIKFPLEQNLQPANSCEMRQIPSPQLSVQLPPLHLTYQSQRGEKTPNSIQKDFQISPCIIMSLVAIYHSKLPFIGKLVCSV